MIGRYKNGNYTVCIYEDGTKIRETKEDMFLPQFFESCDVKITDRCKQCCPFCYEGCAKDGKHADLLSQNWIYYMHPYTELAINGNDLDHPQLDEFLHIMKSQNVIVNMTVNENQLIQHEYKIKEYTDNGLIHGLGVSLTDSSDYGFIEIIKEKEFPNMVVHVINGIVTQDDIENLYNLDVKLLILGYKTIGRGHEYNDVFAKDIEDNQKYLRDNLERICKHFKVVSVDNLAIKQLDVKQMLPYNLWEQRFMGNDGEFTFYIDAVNQEFSMNSIADKNERYKINGMNIDQMFDYIKQNNKNLCNTI